MSRRYRLSKFRPSPELRSLKLESVMTPTPITIEEDRDLTVARRLFREKKFRHLPVVHEGKLTGLLSERDTRIVTLLSEITKIAVADVMSRTPLALPAETKVLEAVRILVTRKFGSVVVLGEHGEILGIFTQEDALRLLLGERHENIPAPTAFPMAQSKEDRAAEMDDFLG